MENTKKTTGRKVPKEERILPMYADGSTFEEIAEAEAVSTQVAVNIVKENIYRAETLQSVKTQAFIKSKGVDSRGRIARLSALQDKILQTIEKRGLEDVPTDKLVSLLLKTNDSLRAELADNTLKFYSEEEISSKSLADSLNSW